MEDQIPPPGPFALSDLRLQKRTHRRKEVLEGYIPWDRLNDLILGETRNASTCFSRWSYKTFNRNKFTDYIRFGCSYGCKMRSGATELPGLISEASQEETKRRRKSKCHPDVAMGIKVGCPFHFYAFHVCREGTRAPSGMCLLRVYGEHQNHGPGQAHDGCTRLSQGVRDAVLLAHEMGVTSCSELHLSALEHVRRAAGLAPLTPFDEPVLEQLKRSFPDLHRDARINLQDIRNIIRNHRPMRTRHPDPLLIS